MTWLDKKLTASAGGPITVILSNGESSAILPGQPVTTIDGLARLATAGYGGSAFATVTGLVVEGGGPTLSIVVVLVGALELTTQEWDAVSGQTGGLTPDAVYYLGPGRGHITTTPSVVIGESIVELGRAVSPTTLSLAPLIPILL